MRSLRCMNVLSPSTFKEIRYRRCNVVLFTSYADSVALHPKPNHFGIPNLSKSIDKYLRYTNPLVSTEQWNRTCEIASSYLSSPSSSRLQKLLEEKAKLEENWLFDWWLSMYLTYRAPVVVHSSPGIRIRTMRFTSDRDWLTHAANIVYGVIDFKTKLESDTLTTEFLSNDVPQCMAQHYGVLGNCRIPGLPYDRMVYRRGGPHVTHPVGHICVFFRNRVYRLEFSDPITHDIADLELIIGQLEHIVSTGSKLPPGPPVGLLTSAPRDDWSRAHRTLRESVSNANILTDLEHSLFVLCLDESANLPSDDSLSATKSRSGHQLTGCSTASSHHINDRDQASSVNCLHGSLVNSGNRWFDKSLQFIVSRDGGVGANFEHTPADAGAVVSIIAQVYGRLDSQDGQALAVTRVPVFARPIELSWQLTAPLVHEIEQAEDGLRRLIEDVDTCSIKFTSFGADAIKKFRMSPDAFVQLALQLAYARLHPDLRPPPTYESGSLRRFHLGRTDTIRSCSPESVAFCHSMSGMDCPDDKRAELLRTAISQHQTFTKELTDGGAFDRHLLGLRLLASSLKAAGDPDFQQPQALFEDPTYNESNQYRLSTSQARSPHDVAVVFGPVVPNGYGVCYNVHGELIQIQSTSFRASSQTQSPSLFLNQVAAALEDMLQVMHNSD